MITITDYQLARLADYFSKNLTPKEREEAKYYNDGRPRYHLTHGIHKNVFLQFEDPAYETVFRLRFSDVLTAEPQFPQA